MSRIDTRYVPNEWEIYAHKLEAKVLKLDARMKRLEANQIAGRCATCKHQQGSARNVAGIHSVLCSFNGHYTRIDGIEYCDRWEVGK